MIKEACVGNIKEALLAEEFGANRIELCENLFEGGTTPSYGTIKFCVDKLNIPTMTMIRPRGGDFNYSDAEFEVMKEDIKICKTLGSYGVVFGILTDDLKIDKERTKELVELAAPMQVTFHKAFDLISNPYEEIENLIACGVNRLLTSGTKDTAEEGMEVLNKLSSIVNGRLQIVAAGKVTKDNLSDLSEKINCNEFHGKRIVF